MAKRNSQLTELLIVAQDDYLTIVDTSAGQSKRVSVKNLTGLPDVGWTATGESWSFSSYTAANRRGVITVPTDATTKYSIGMKVRFSQTTGGTKYGRIIAVTSTTLTVFMMNTATLANEAISSPVYSPLDAPIATSVDWGEQEPWQTPTLLNSWINYGSGFDTVGYMKDSLGFVHVRGVIKNGVTTTATPVFNLPAGYRPAGSMYLPTVNGGSNTFGCIELQSGGNLNIIIGSATYTMLGHIVYKAEL